MERPSRRGASKAAKAELAAAKLKQLKDKGGKGRLNDIEEDDGPQAVYDVVRARAPVRRVRAPARRVDPIAAIVTAIDSPIARYAVPGSSSPQFPAPRSRSLLIGNFKYFLPAQSP